MYNLFDVESIALGVVPILLWNITWHLGPSQCRRGRRRRKRRRRKWRRRRRQRRGRRKFGGEKNWYFLSPSIPKRWHRTSVTKYWQRRGHQSDQTWTVFWAWVIPTHHSKTDCLTVAVSNSEHWRRWTTESKTTLGRVGHAATVPVSYTHLTLPTRRTV